MKTSFQKKEKSHPVAEHRLSALHLPLLNVCREKISSHSGLKSRVEKILCFFGVSLEGEYNLELFSVVWHGSIQESSQAWKVNEERILTTDSMELRFLVALKSK